MTTLVDDNDSIIVYSDNWIGGGSLAEYQNTAHGTNTTGATARFTFTGAYLHIVNLMIRTSRVSDTRC
jgi:hypothetical protein